MKLFTCCFALTTVFGFPGMAFSENNPPLTPENIIRKSIDARGGREALAKYLNHRARSRVLLIQGQRRTPASFISLHRSYPKSSKFECDVKALDFRMVNVFDGKNFWSNRNGTITEGNRDDIRDCELSVHSSNVHNLFFFLINSDRKAYRLTILPAATILDADAIGVSVSCLGYPDINLYFDEKTWLLVKKNYRLQQKDGRVEPHEEYFSQYKKMKGGVMWATKKTVIDNRKKHFEVELVDIEPLAEVKDSEFNKPE